MKVTMFRGLKFTKPKEIIDITIVLEKIKSDIWKERVLKCREDLKKKDYLPVFTPTGEFTHRSIAGLSRYNGIVYLDIDHISTQNTNVQSLKEICKTIKWIYAAYITPSGDGMKILVKTNATIETYRDTEEQVSQAFFKLTGVNRDPRCKDIARIHYISYDPEILVNEESTTFLHTPTLFEG